MDLPKPSFRLGRSSTLPLGRAFHRDASQSLVTMSTYSLGRIDSSVGTSVSHVAQRITQQTTPSTPNAGSPTAPGSDAIESMHAISLGKRPAFFWDQANVEAISRSINDTPPAKKYAGFNRVCRSLRHVATAICHGMMEKMSVNPIEVQASIINGRLHVSSNFNSERILMALHYALTGPLPGKASRPTNLKDKQQVTDGRAQRHLEQLQKYFLGEGDKLDKLKEKALAEISNGIGLPGDNNLTRDKIGAQSLAAFDILRQALQAAAAVEPRFDLIIIHHPYHDPSLAPVLPPGVTQTMHAEQNIENALAASQQYDYHQAPSPSSASRGGNMSSCQWPASTFRVPPAMRSRASNARTAAYSI